MQIILTEEEYNKLKTPNEDWVSRKKLQPAFDMLTAQIIDALHHRDATGFCATREEIRAKLQKVWTEFQICLKP